MGGSKELPIQNGAAPVPSGLSRSISMCNITKTNKIRQACQADLQPGESPFFLRYFMTMTRYMVILPPLLVMVKMIREKLHKILFDDYIGSTLQRAKIINWCPTTKPLYPKWTRGMHLLLSESEFLFVQNYTCIDVSILKNDSSKCIDFCMV